MSVPEESSNPFVITEARLVNILQFLLKNLKHDAQKGNKKLHNIICGACANSSVRGDRYKCLQCYHCDLCASCFESRREPMEHKSGHLFVHLRLPDELFGRPVTTNDLTIEKLKRFYAREKHESIICDGCSAEDFTGLRFKCDTCPSYDLCYKCARKGIVTKNHKSTHPLILTFRRGFMEISPDDIALGEKLGSGAFGKPISSVEQLNAFVYLIGSVYKGLWISKNLSVACKVIKVSDTDQHCHLEKAFYRELDAYEELSSGCILKIYGYVIDKQSNRKVYTIVMEYMTRGSLAAILKEKNAICLWQKVHIARQIASGMRKIHEHHMIHRDIRPDNILVDEHYNCKIGDMGIARVVDPMNLHTRIGYQAFMPPELASGTYNQKLDIFTFGLTLNQLFTETSHSYRPLAKEKIVFEKESRIFRDLIRRCTSADPQHRPAAIELEKTLQLYCGLFDEIVLKETPGYMILPTEIRNEIYLKFYEKTHEQVSQFIRKEFPIEFLAGPTPVSDAKVENHRKDRPRVRCPIQ